ncbi:MAG TPA: aldo/keto reductase [Acidimicrobiales bacterium]|nr:aldo/keto reductase [Acidimicrobiales bacterium]
MTTPGAVEHVDLAGAGRMPLVGFGTWQLRGDAAYRAVLAAIQAGYRHIDTATMYGNEREIGRAIRDSGLAREDLFLTSKLPPERAGREQATIEESLRELGTDYLDLWLIHWPPRRGQSSAVWGQFLAMRDAGRTRAVGVSNYGLGEIDELVQASGATPAVDQVRWSPFAFDAGFLAGCRRRGVVLEGYSPFKASRLGDAVLADVARAHEVSPAQVIVRWHVQHRVVVIPRSSAPSRIASNLDVFGFELTDAEMRRLDALSSSR